MKKIVLILSIISFLYTRYAFAQEATSGYCGPKDSEGNYRTNCEWVYDSTTKTLTISGQGSMYSSDHINQFPWSNNSYYNDITNIVIENGITTIGTHAFFLATNVKNITLPDTLISLGWNALRGTGLTSVIIPDSVTYIGGAVSNPPFSQKVTAVYCSKAQQKICQDAISWSGLNSSIFKTYEKYGDEYYYGGKFYTSPHDIGTPHYIKKRIYTVDEANRIAGDKNTVTIKYK